MTRETQASTGDTRVALVTGGTAGLGRALVTTLAQDGWRVITDGRSGERARQAHLPSSVTVLTGDVATASHRGALADAVRRLGRLDLLAHNASTLGPLPMRHLSDVSGDALTAVWQVNLVAAHELNRLLLGLLGDCDGVLVSLSSDAAVEHYETWGPYAVTKAALDQLTLTTAAESGVTGYAVDPGDMRTGMQQDAFPGEDISDRPLPETVVPHLLTLLERRPPSGRYRAREVVVR